MNVTVKQYTSLDKIFPENKVMPTEINSAKVFLGERFSYQLYFHADENKLCKIDVNSELKDYITLYKLDMAPCDMTTRAEIRGWPLDSDYLTYKNCSIPDILIPLSEQKDGLRISAHPAVLWVRIDIPADFKAGDYSIEITATDDEGIVAKETMEITVLPYKLPESTLKYTQWFYCDCIANYHNVEIFSDKHWELIENYIKTAADVGINMLLTPIHTPPLDTAIGTMRPVIQLVDVNLNNGKYTFEMSKLTRWVKICKKHGIKYFETAHLYSQWGAKCAPNIMVNEDGNYHLKFGWHVDGNDESYKEFLGHYIPAVAQHLKSLNVLEDTYFHISDEPNADNIDTYAERSAFIKSVAGDIKVLDALSNLEFYEKGYIKMPVPASNHIEPFIEAKVPELWVYYCCGQGYKVSNRFIAMSSYRNRIMGVQMYKFDIKGFLHWGFNFYNTSYSNYPINPYLTTSADHDFPAGDPFSVYPATNGAYPSLRALVFYEGLEDIRVLRLAESILGREKVIEIIDDVAKTDVRFTNYPYDTQYIYKLRDRIIEEISK